MKRVITPLLEDLPTGIWQKSGDKAGRSTLVKAGLGRAELPQFSRRKEAWTGRVTSVLEEGSLDGQSYLQFLERRTTLSRVISSFLGEGDYSAQSYLFFPGREDYPALRATPAPGVLPAPG